MPRAVEMDFLRNIKYIFVLIGFTHLTTLAAESRIMALGDSITRGAQSYYFLEEGFSASTYRLHDHEIPNNLRSYREHLHDLLTQTSCKANISWVGSEEFTERTPVNHEGHGGWRADQIHTEIALWLTDHNPDIVLLNIGTNDLIQGQSVANITQDIEGILDKIDEYETSANKQVNVYIGNMVPIVGWYANHDRSGDLSDTETRRAELSENIKNLAYFRSSLGDKIKVVDINSNFFVDESHTTNCQTQQPGNPENMMMTRCQAHLPPNSPDGIHPNLLGDKFIAQKIFSELRLQTDICNSELEISADLTTAIRAPHTHDVSLDENTTFTGSVLNTGSSQLEDILIHIRDRDKQEWHTIAGKPEVIDINESEMEWSYNTTLPQGNYTIFVKATDSEGAASSRFGRRFSTQPNIFEPDNLAPLVEFTSPENNSIHTPQQPLVFNGTSSDIGGSEIKEVLVYVRNRDRKAWDIIAVESNLTHTSNSTADWSYSAELEPGNYTVFVRATDINDNQSTYTTRKFQIQ